LAVKMAHRLVDRTLSEARNRDSESQTAVPTTETLLDRPKNMLEFLPEVDAQAERYACRKCRTIVFGQDHLQNPPHIQSKHRISQRKQQAGMTTNVCQSLFLKEGVNWLGDLNEESGKLSCPRCMVKMGTWHWSGAQCSCKCVVRVAI
jgi:dual specificity phosphatase 12